MAEINWNTALSGVPPEWRATRGAGVRIAVLDSGADLEREELQHLRRAGRMFDAGLPNFVLTDSAMTGNDDVLGVDGHGTRLLQTLAADSEGDGPRGIVPAADVFIIKIASRNGLIMQRFFLNGLQIALKLDVDIIVTGQNPVVVRRQTVHDLSVETDKLFAELVSRKIVLICPAFGANKPADLLRFPADRPESLVASAPLDTLLGAADAEKLVGAAVDFLLPRQISFEGQSTEITNGLAAACLGGITALWIAREKQRNPPRLYRRPDKAAVIVALQPAAQPFTVAACRQSRTLQFFTAHLQPVV